MHTSTSCRVFTLPTAIFSMAVVTALASVAKLHAEVRLPQLLSDHAVLQRDAPIHLWGWSSPKEKVQVQFHAQKRSVSANEYGEWSLWLAPEVAGGPFTLSIQGESGAQISYPDMLVGDVWFASGQSNMEMPLKGFDAGTRVQNGDAEIAAATLPQVRLVRVEHKTASFPQQDLTGTWTLCTPDTAANFSAVAYFFGRGIQQKEHVPIGLIDSTWGGTPVEAWTSLDALSADASLMPAFASWARFSDQQSNLLAVASRGEGRRHGCGSSAPGQAESPMASVCGVLGSRTALQRNDRSSHALHYQRRHLVPGRDQQRPRARAAL